MEALNSAGPEEMAGSDTATPAAEVEGGGEMDEVEEVQEKGKKEGTSQSDSDGRANVGSEGKH